MVNKQTPLGISSTYSLKGFGTVLCVPHSFSKSHRLLGESLSVEFSAVVSPLTFRIRPTGVILVRLPFFLPRRHRLIHKQRRHGHQL